MHCPGCGQQQISTETKFCSRCGLPLGLVSEVLSHGGFLPQLAELHNKKKSLFTKKNGVMASVFWFIFFVPLLTSIFGGVFGIDVLGSICALIGVFGGLMIFIFSLVFLPSSRPAYVPYPRMMQGMPQVPGLYAPHQQALPPQQTMPVSTYAPPKAGRWRDTNDLEPASVTESTTRLLTKEEKHD